MIKASAYGMGMLKIAKKLNKENIDYLGVAFTNEGKLLRDNNITCPILVMNAVRSFKNLIACNLTPVIFCFKQLDSFINYLNSNYLISFDVGVMVERG